MTAWFGVSTKNHFSYFTNGSLNLGSVFNATNFFILNGLVIGLDAVSLINLRTKGLIFIIFTFLAVAHVI